MLTVLGKHMTYMSGEDGFSWPWKTLRFLLLYSFPTISHIDSFVNITDKITTYTWFCSTFFFFVIKESYFNYLKSQ